MSSIREQHIDTSTKSKASRLSFGEEVAELGTRHPQIVVLDADLSKSTQTQFFAEKFPTRFFNMGIAEANMIGTAAGLAMAGKVPFAASFGCFLTGRFDQIRMSVSFMGANVRLVGTHAGVAIGEDGHSQMALEDVALMRTLPNMIVFQPGDDRDTREFIRWSLTHEGPCYMRLTRQNLANMKPGSGYTFGLGRWMPLSSAPVEGSVVLLGSGGPLEATVDAADKLAAAGLKVSVYNANWLKPIDEAVLFDIAKAKPKLVVTVEDHYITGGLGSAVAEFYADQHLKVDMLRIGVKSFGQSGSPKDTTEFYGLSAPRITARVQEELARFAR